jgi:hypothetical protein
MLLWLQPCIWRRCALFLPKILRSCSGLQLACWSLWRFVQQKCSSGAGRRRRWPYSTTLLPGYALPSKRAIAGTRIKLWRPLRPSSCDILATVGLLSAAELRVALQDGRERADHRLPRPQRGPTHHEGAAACANGSVRSRRDSGLVGLARSRECCFRCEFGAVLRCEYTAS